jgi:hypothetical protein
MVSPFAIKKQIDTRLVILSHIKDGLNGNAHVWNRYARSIRMKYAEKLGFELATVTALKKRGLELKRGVEPVVIGIWGPPLNRKAGLYLVKCQTKPTKKRKA